MHSHSKYYYTFSVDKMHINIKIALKGIILHTEQVCRVVSSGE